jgi:hypothetical protein
MLLFDGDSGVHNWRFNVVCNIRLWLCIGLSTCSPRTWCYIQFNSILSGSERTILTRYQGRYRHKHRQKHYCAQQITSQLWDTSEKTSRPRPKAKCRSGIHTHKVMLMLMLMLTPGHTHSRTQSFSCSSWPHDTHTHTHSDVLAHADSKALINHTAGYKHLILTTIWAISPPISN